MQRRCRSRSSGMGSWRSRSGSRLPCLGMCCSQPANDHRSCSNRARTARQNMTIHVLSVIHFFHRSCGRLLDCFSTSHSHSAASHLAPSLQTAFPGTWHGGLGVSCIPIKDIAAAASNVQLHCVRPSSVVDIRISDFVLLSHQYALFFCVETTAATKLTTARVLIGRLAAIAHPCSTRR